MFKGYHHIGLITNDAAASYQFYTEGLGGKEVHQFPMGAGKTIYLVDLGGNAVVEIIPRGYEGAESAARWAHIALATDDAKAAFDAAVAAGARVQSEPKQVKLGTMEVINAFVLGPDDEIIEMFQVL